MAPSSGAFSLISFSHQDRLDPICHAETQDDDCGVYLHSLCLDYSGECQPSSNGMSDVIFPEPVGDISGTGYRVRITEVGGGDSACSDEFYLMSSSDADFMEDWGDPFIAVVSPTKYSVAVAGQDFTVEVSYLSLHLYA